MPYRIDPHSPLGWTYVDDHGQDDLTYTDQHATTTRKVFPADEQLPVPTQWPAFVPDTVIDEHGRPV